MKLSGKHTTDAGLAAYSDHQIHNPGCALCPRLVGYRQELREENPDWHNAPVPSFGGLDARLLIVGLAPGKKGANRTGRPFTGDKAGEYLFGALLRFGFAEGKYQSRADDGISLQDCRITNAVKCVPPKNSPKSDETQTCGRFLSNEIKTMPNLRAILCLGRTSHEATLKAMDLSSKDFEFGHGARHKLPSSVRLYDSYHCSQQNTNTRRLTEDMFHKVFRAVRRYLRTNH